MARCPIDYGTCHRETEGQCPTRDENGAHICTLGVTETPMLAKNLLTVYEVKHRPDGMTELRLSRTHVAYLGYLADHGGETPYDKTKLSPEAHEHIQKMIAFGVIQELSIIGRSEVLHRLTDMGRNAIAQARKAMGVA